MGLYINKGNEGFLSAIEGHYIDKTGMIAVVNKTLFTERRFTCVTRCRRFGKSLAAKMLCAYYDRSCDSRSLFEGLAISLPDKEGEDKQYEKHLNKYPVISLDITKFTTRFPGDVNIVKFMQEDIKAEILETYPNVMTRENDDLMEALLRIATQTGDRFIMVIDEWDAILREYEGNAEVVDEYVNLLRRLFKGDDSVRVFAGAYMTGILPIKKYKTQSALNNFREYSVVQPGKLESYFGFTPSEVVKLAEGQDDVSLEDLKKWYDGYSIGKEPSIELTHDNDTSILPYNDENSLACVLSIAYYYAKNDYVIHRELATGKGFADLVLISRRNVDSPAMVLELKYNKEADAAIDQIRRKNYPGKVSEYCGDILLVGINHDKNGAEGKKHTCKIEKITKA